MPNIKEKLVDILRLKPYNMGEVSAGRLADHLIANGVTIQKWISVEERLPEYGDKVLVCDTHEDYVGIAVLQKGKYLGWLKKENYWRWNDMDVAFEEFTHWMPLPSTEGLK